MRIPPEQLLEKPFNWESLLERVRAVLAGRGRQGARVGATARSSVP